MKTYTRGRYSHCMLAAVQQSNKLTYRSQKADPQWTLYRPSYTGSPAVK